MNRKFALIGNPLGHSLSPQIHKRLFELAGRAGEYVLCEIPPEKLADSYDYLHSLDGFNVTIPHKIPIVGFCGRLDGSAERYGAVNCIKNGSETVGYNTDVDGFIKATEQLGASLCSDVCLLGCGGVGRMMALETAFHGGRLTIAVRRESLEKAEAVRREILVRLPESDITVTSLDQLSGCFDLMINSTPLGMFPHIETTPVDKAVLKNVRFLFDAVYNPIETRLMREARESGAKVFGGMSMLVWQAVKAHEIWDGSKYSADCISALISETERLIK